MITVYSGRTGSNVITVQHVKPVTEKTARRRANEDFYKLGLRYHDGLPISEIDAILEAHGFSVLEEAIYCGRKGSAHEQVGPFTWFTMSWHKMEVTGRYEVTAYVS